MFVGGRVCGRVQDLGTDYSVSLWLWNGLPVEARPVAGWAFSRGLDYSLGPWGDHLGMGGAGPHAGKLIFLHGEDASTIVAGKTEIPRWEWRHAVLVRQGEAIRVYLNGELEIETRAPAGFPAGFDRVFIGGRSDRADTWEGRLDEVAIFNRALTPDEISRLTLR
jgi:hypothetical protein